jgi:hypothetical protein
MIKPVGALIRGRATRRWSVCAARAGGRSARPPR